MNMNEENTSGRSPEEIASDTAELNTTPTSAAEETSERAEGAITEHNEPAPAAAPAKDPLIGIKTLFEYLELFVCSICIVLLIFMFGVRLCDVVGESMEKTLYEREKLLISNLFYEPERGDIIVFHQTGPVLNEPVVKRVIATGGEWVSLEFIKTPREEQRIIVRIYDENKNLKEELDESGYVYYDTSVELETSILYDGMFEVPEGYLFVMGDNRNNSTDSRSGIIGLVDERRVLGRVLVRVHPFSKFGRVD